MRIIVTLSGGMASAWCAGWAFRNFKKEDIILYFNDTKWEHPDLYRFLNDLEKHYNHKIYYDSDGRDPGQVFLDQNFLGNNKVPLCSKILKAERLQKFFKDGDLLIFGISKDEIPRIARLYSVYSDIMKKTKRYALIRFPLIEENITKDDILLSLQKIKIDIPLLYKLGFSHNNCSGGCVRSGKTQWKLLLEKLPEIYKQREELEEAFRDYIGQDVHYLKDETLKHLRERIQNNLFNQDNEPNETAAECIGICDTQN